MAVGWRRAKARARVAAALRAPGASPETALALADLRAIDGLILQQTRACGGGFRPFGERSVELDGRSLRVAKLECGRCEAERLLYFEHPPLLH